MIRINLATAQMPAQKLDGVESFEVADGDTQKLQSQGAMRGLMIFILPLALYAWEFQNIPELKQKLRSKSTLLESLTVKNDQAKGAVEEIKKFKEDEARLQKQIDTLDGLQRERLREVKILDNIQKDIPEKVWFNRLDFNEGKLTLSGVAVSDSDLTLLMENLSKSVFLSEVNLVKSTELPGEKRTLKKFEIVCVLDKPAPSNLEGPKK